MPSELNQKRFTILDGMILIAAIAAAIKGWMITLWVTWASASPISLDVPLSMSYWPRGTYEWISVGTLAGLSLACAILLMNLWRWRAIGWRVSLAPGFVGCLAIVVAWLLHWGPYAIAAIFTTRVSELALALAEPTVHRAEPWPSVTAIVMSWLVLWLGIGWRPEPTWLDRSGRILSMLWLAGGIASKWFDLTL